MTLSRQQGMREKFSWGLAQNSNNITSFHNPLVRASHKTRPNSRHGNTDGKSCMECGGIFNPITHLIYNFNNACKSNFKKAIDWKGNRYKERTPRKEIQIALKYIKRYLNSIIKGEKKIKFHQRFYVLPDCQKSVRYHHFDNSMGESHSHSFLVGVPTDITFIENNLAVPITTTNGYSLTSNFTSRNTS